MSKLEENLEQQTIDETAQNYKSRGYSVFKKPKQDDLPEFLKGLTPDIYAVKNEDNLIIQVVSKNNSLKLHLSEELSNRLRNVTGWRFDLIMISSRESESINQNQELLNLKEIEAHLQEIQKFISLKQNTTSFILFRPVLEALIRNIAKNYNIDENIPITSMAKSLLSRDVIKEPDYQIFVKSWKKLNLLIHGYKYEVTLQDLDEIVYLVNSLMSPKQIYPTITYEGSGIYYIGDKIKFTGTSIRNQCIYLFIIGKGYARFGSRFNVIKSPVKDEEPGSFTRVMVDSNGIWEYTWNTSEAGLDLKEGQYTIYVANHPFSLKSLDKTMHEKATIVLKRPFIVASVNSSTIAEGDDLIIYGTATGNPEHISIWIFGEPTTFSTCKVLCDKSGSFQRIIKGEVSKNFHPGQYYIVVQHPMMNGKSDVIAEGKNIGTIWDDSIAINVEKMQPYEALKKLLDLLNNRECDDTYTTLSFVVEQPWMRIDPIGYKKIGDLFAITGTTNVAVGNSLHVEITTTGEEKKFPRQITMSIGDLGVIKGETYNQWNFDVDSSTYKPGKYMVLTQIKDKKLESHEFFIIEK